HCPPACSLSPDGRWLIWSPNTPNMKATIYTAATLDGMQEIRWTSKQDLSETPLWLHDSRHWLELVYGSNKGEHVIEWLIVHDCQNPSEGTNITVPGTSGASIVGITRDEHVLQVDWNDGNPASSIVLYDYGLTTHRSSVRKYAIHLPVRATFGGMAISP